MSQPALAISPGLLPLVCLAGTLLPFAGACAKKGDVIDLWAGVRSLSLREAALDLVRTFGLEPAPGPGTEKRNG